MTSSLETEWDYSRRKRRYRQKKKIGKANEKRKKEIVKSAKDDEVNGQGKTKGKRSTPDPPGATGNVLTSESWLQLRIK